MEEGLIDGLEELRDVMELYKPHLKYWEDVIVYTNGNYGYLEFYTPKGKHKFTSLIKEFPLTDLRDVLKIYDKKLHVINPEYVRKYHTV